MHRTTTLAALLATVAVSAALTGCMTIRHPAPPDRPPAPRPEGRAAPRAVQAPAHEALERTDPAPTAAAPRAATPSPRPPTARPTPRPRPAHPRPPYRAPEPAPRPHGRSTGAPRPTAGTAVGTADLCALGRRYGGWRPDSPQAVICERTYGH